MTGYSRNCIAGGLRVKGLAERRSTSPAQRFFGIRAATCHRTKPLPDDAGRPSYFFGVPFRRHNYLCGTWQGKKLHMAMTDRQHSNAIVGKL